MIVLAFLAGVFVGVTLALVLWSRQDRDTFWVRCVDCERGE